MLITPVLPIEAPLGAAYRASFGVLFTVAVIGLGVWLTANGPIRVPFLRWRFRGGRLI